MLFDVNARASIRQTPTRMKCKPLCSLLISLYIYMLDPSYLYCICLFPVFVYSMKQLRMRYEFPNDKNRWENPLFHVKMGEMDPTADAPPSISTPVSQAAADSSPDGVPQTVFEKVSDATAKPVAPKKSSWKPKGSKKIAETVATTAVAVATMHVDPKGSGETGVWFSGSHVKQPVFTSSGESGDSGALQDFSPAAVCQRVLNFIYSSSVTGGATGSTSGNKGNLPASVHPSPAGQMPNASTMSMPHVQANILYELDRVSALVTNKIIAHVKQHPADSAFTITDVVPPLLLPEYDRVFNIHKQITVAELHRHRRQFVKVNTLCPPVIHTTDGLSDNDSLCASLGCLYIDFLSAQL